MTHPALAAPDEIPLEAATSGVTEVPAAYRELVVASRWAQAAVAGPVVCSTLMIGVFARRIIVFRSALAGHFLSRAVALAHDRQALLVSRLQAPAFVLGVVALLYWVYQACTALRSWAGRSTRFTPGWAVAFWFIPILNILRIYQVMRELWVTSGADLDRSGSSRIGLWYIAYYSTAVAHLQVKAFQPQIHSTADRLTFAWMQAGEEALRLLAALLLISIIRDVTRAVTRLKVVGPGPW